MSEQRDCPICGSSRKNVLYTQKFSALSGALQLSGYDVVSCLDCGFAYADAIPDQAWFDSYYRDMSKYSYDQRGGEVSPADRARFQSVAQMIAKHLPERKSRILDYGCATGSLLHHLKQAGYSDLLGTDKAASSASLAQKLYSVTVVNRNLSELAHEQQPFDLLILSGVLEHVRDVKNLLKDIPLVINQKGLLYVEVPDAIGFADCMDAPFQEFSIEHINFFSKRSLTNLLAYYGFEPVEVLRMTRDYTAISKMSVLCGFFRLTGNRNQTPMFDDETSPALRAYIEKSRAEETRVSSIIDSLVQAQTPLLVWGVGTYTLHLIKSTNFSKLNIVAFADSNKNYHGRTLLDKQILLPEELKKYPHQILISTNSFQAEIEEQIRETLRLPNQILTLKNRLGAV